MSIVHDDGDEGQTRVDRMIDEFRQAQSRRQAKSNATSNPVRGDDEAVESQRDAPAKPAAVAFSIPSH
jgi:hypothetical protein